jgi:hypothetical protein
MGMEAGLGDKAAEEVGPPMEQLGRGKGKAIGDGPLTPESKAVMCKREEGKGARDGPATRAARR